MPTRSPIISEATAVFHAYLLDGKGGGEKVDFEHPGAIEAERGFRWVDLNFASPQAQGWVHSQQHIPEVARDLMLESETRPGCFEFENGLLLILRGVNLNEGARLEDMISIRIWIDERGMITCRRRRMRSVEALVGQIEAGNGAASVGQLMTLLTGELANHITQADEHLDSRLIQTEKPDAETDPVIRESMLSQLRRQSATLRRYLGPQKEALLRLQNYRGSLLSDTDLKDVRFYTEQIVQSLEDIELIREQAISYQDEHFNKLAMEQNARIYVLSIVTAIFLPLSFLTGLLGINVGGIPGAESPIGFIAMVLICLGVAVCLLLYFWRKRWL